MFCSVFVAFPISIGIGWEGKGWESICTMLASSRDAARSRALSLLGPGMSGLRSSRSDGNFTIPSYPCCATRKSGV